MQLRNFFIAGILALATFASCSKKNDDVKANIPIEGTWVGKYSILSEPYNNYYSFKFKAGGTMELLDASKQKIGEGNWGLTNAGAIVTGTYSLVPPQSGTYSFIGNFNNSTAELDGTWGNGANEYGGGYWYMDKTN